MGAEELAERVKDYMHRLYPPSEIDGKLGLDPGTAHDIAVAEWARDKREGR